MYTSELENCLECGREMKVAYTSGPKTVQTMGCVMTIAHRPKNCANPSCGMHPVKYKSAQWQQIAPLSCTYGYDVIAQIGWQRQRQYERFESMHASLQSRLQISEAEVRLLYHERYLPLLACHERQYLDELIAVSERAGLVLSLDGLAPEGGEPQLWLVRELPTGLTIRSGWLSQQDQGTFINFLQPIADMGLRVAAVLSDKQRGLEPAVPLVFREAKHGFCQSHYLRNIATPIADEAQAMKVRLRKAVRSAVGTLIRQEKVEKPGVLTVTGLVPTPVEQPEEDCSQAIDPVIQEHEKIVEDLLRRVRYLLTLKGRPPFRLAGVEMFERLNEVQDCLAALLPHRTDARLEELSRGLRAAITLIQDDYTELRQAADWLEQIAALLDPDGKPSRSGDHVQHALYDYLENIRQQCQDIPRLHKFYQSIHKTTRHYTPGLFHCYDISPLPRTNNDRESEFRELNRRLLSTTGQSGLVKRIIQRQGAWELIPRPASLRDTVSALSCVDPHDFSQERQRFRNHRARFRLHSRSPKRSRSQLLHLEQRWKALPPLDSS